MSQKNKKLAKIKRKEQKKNEQNKKRIKFYSKICKTTNIEEEINRLPSNCKNYIYSISWPSINIDFSQVADHPDINVIIDKIKYRLDNNFLIIDENKLALSEVHGILGVLDGVRSIHHSHASFFDKKHFVPNIERIENKYKNLLKLSKEILDKLIKIWDEIKDDYIQQVISCASQEIVAYYSFDKIGLFPILQLKQTEGKKTYISISINKNNPIEKDLCIEGKNRKIYQCYGYNYINLVSCELPLDTIDNKIVLPVYIQDHAVNRLIERLGINPLGYIFENVYRSLLSPKVSGKNGDSYLIDYRYFSIKLGYLVVSIHKNIAVIRTFKFITMTGTPEFYKLKKELRGTREEFEYWGLDSLNIINSDLAKDEQLRDVFSKCNLDHLFKLSETISSDKSKFEIAKDIKKYFKL